MQSQLNGTVTFLALQRLAEQAWDQGDTERLMYLSAAVDAATLACLDQEARQARAV